jgi:hypothetical protein
MKEMIPTWDIDLKQPQQADFFRESHRKAVQGLGLI